MDTLPNISADFLEDELLLQKIALGRKQIMAGDYLSEEEFDREVDSWD